MNITEKPFGSLPSGESVTAYTLSNDEGAELTVLDYGATISALKIPVNKEKVDVVLGFNDAEGYVHSRTLPAPPYFGAVIGRYAGRIKNGTFTLGFTKYQLNKNDGNNTLHGGTKGFDAVMWRAKRSENDESLSLEYISSEGEEHFPGELLITLKYTLTEEDEVIIEYTATTNKDTIVNLTQHSYFNLDGHKGSVSDQLLKLYTNKLLEKEVDNIPTGKVIAAEKKDFDFTTETPCPLHIDDSFVLNDHSSPAATLRSRKTGISLTVYTDQPSVHIYVGGECGGLRGKENARYHAQSGICFETQNFPDAPNQAEFPNAILKKGDLYRQKTTWKFSVD